MAQGPYNKKPPAPVPPQTLKSPATPLPETTGEAGEEGHESGGYEARKDVDEELLATGLAQHDLECLRAFYLELRDKFFNGCEDGYVFVPNDELTPLIESALGVKIRFGGDFGAVYSSRVRPFAESRIQSSVKGWNFKVKKVLVFIDGELLPKMAHPHPSNLNVPTGASPSDAYEGIHSLDRAPAIPLDDSPVTLNVLGTGALAPAAQQLLIAFAGHVAAENAAKRKLQEAEGRREGIVARTEELRIQLAEIQAQLSQAESEFADASRDVSGALAEHRKVLELMSIPEEVRHALQAILDLQNAPKK